MDCGKCSHRAHSMRCGQPIIEEIRDDVGIFCQPTGIARSLIVDVCHCSGD